MSWWGWLVAMATSSSWALWSVSQLSLHPHECLYCSGHFGKPDRATLWQALFVLCSSDLELSENSGISSELQHVVSSEVTNSEPWWGEGDPNVGNCLRNVRPNCVAASAELAQTAAGGCQLSWMSRETKPEQKHQNGRQIMWRKATEYSDQGRIYKDAGPWAGDSFGAQCI